jgi:hypothetical protein
MTNDEQLVENYLNRFDRCDFQSAHGLPIEFTVRLVESIDRCNRFWLSGMADQLSER